MCEKSTERILQQVWDNIQPTNEFIVDVLAIVSYEDNSHEILS